MISDAEYVRILRKLKRYFEWRNCGDAEDLAQETLVRGLRRLAEGSTIYSEQTENFFMGIARHVLMEQRKKARSEAPPPEHEQVDERDQAAAFHGRILLRECLEVLGEKDRDLLVSYVLNGAEPTAEANNLTPNALRVRISRIRAKIDGHLKLVSE